MNIQSSKQSHTLKIIIWIVLVVIILLLQFLKCLLWLRGSTFISIIICILIFVVGLGTILIPSIIFILLV
jgi:glucan phosphoethanolaminetransferase (alkaline phosphatase superfamily)